MEGGDGRLAYIMGLLHDVGKIRARGLDLLDSEATVEVIEEKLSPYTDNLMLRRIIDGLTKGGSIEALAVHDADYLSKAGVLGVATFFSKWTAKGLTVDEAVIGKLSRELTILSNIERHLVTEYAKKLGRHLAKVALKSYRQLLKELKIQGLNLRLVRRKARGYSVVLVVPITCPSCNGEVKVSRGLISRGKACTEYSVTIKCKNCDWNMEESTCILETATDSGICCRDRLYSTQQRLS